MSDSYEDRLERLERAVSDLATIGIRTAGTVDRLALNVDRLATNVDRLATWVDAIGQHVDRLTIIVTDHIENHRGDQ